MTNDVPKPILAMPKSLVEQVRYLAEECADELDNETVQNPGLRRRSVTMEPLRLPDGSTAVIRCDRSKRGRDSIRITFYSSVQDAP